MEKAIQVNQSGKKLSCENIVSLQPKMQNKFGSPDEFPVKKKSDDEMIVEPEQPQDLLADLDFEELYSIVSSVPPIQIQYNGVPTLTFIEEIEIIQESQLQQYIQNLSEQAFQFLLAGKLKDSLVKYRICEHLISDYMNVKGDMSSDIVIFALMNLGLVYYKIGFLEDSLICYESCLVSMTQSPNIQKDQNQIFSPNNYFKNLDKKIKNNKLKIKIHIQICLILSEMIRHEEALIHSQYAIDIAHKLLLDFQAISFYMIHQNQLQQDQRINNYNKSSESKQRPAINVMRNTSYKNDKVYQSQKITLLKDKEFDDYNEISQKYINFLSILMKVRESIEKVQIPIINKKRESILKFLIKQCHDIPFQEPSIDMLFKDLDPNFFLLQTTILGFLQAKPISWEDIQKQLQFQNEINQENIIWLLATVSTCYYCSSTESRFMEDFNQLNKDQDGKMLHSELQLTKSLMIGYQFLKHDLPWVNQIIKVYHRFHNFMQQKIQEEEDEQLPDDYWDLKSQEFFLMKPIKGIKKMPAFLPLVRISINHKKLQNNTYASPNKIQDRMTDQLAKTIQIQQLSPHQNGAIYPKIQTQYLKAKTLTSKKDVVKEIMEMNNRQDAFQSKLYKTYNINELKTSNNSFKLRSNKSREENKKEEQKSSIPIEIKNKDEIKNNQFSLAFNDNKSLKQFNNMAMLSKIYNTTQPITKIRKNPFKHISEQNLSNLKENAKKIDVKQNNFLLPELNNQLLQNRVKPNFKNKTQTDFKIKNSENIDNKMLNLKEDIKLNKIFIQNNSKFISSLNNGKLKKDDNARQVLLTKNNI